MIRTFFVVPVERYYKNGLSLDFSPATVDRQRIVSLNLNVN